MLLIGFHSFSLLLWFLVWSILLNQLLTDVNLDNKRKSNNMDIKVLLKGASLFDVHKWSDFPEVDNVVKDVFAEIKAHRKSKGIRIRGEKRVLQCLKVVIIDLWAANKLSLNPYRAISRNKTSYQKETRYRKIFLTYDYLIPVINDLCDLGYIEQRLGYKFERYSRSTRIKATEKLIEKVLSPEYGLDEKLKKEGALALVSRSSASETIFLKDENKELIDYKDNKFTNGIRKNLELVNEKIRDTRITLDITDDQFEELMNRLKADEKYRQPIDFTRVELYRVFNNSSFEQGGRFYGAWWQNLPRGFRRYIEINRRNTVEIDYSGHHIRILYAKEGIEPPDDPYDLEGFERDIQKEAMLILLNAETMAKAAKALLNDGINPRIIGHMAIRHKDIRQYFHTGIGMQLMYTDSVIAEAVMLEMLKRGATVLPVHDSFIVRKSYSDELEEVMVNVFEKYFDKPAKLKLKLDVIQEKSDKKEKIRESLIHHKDDLDIVTFDDVATYYKNRKWHHRTWGF